MKFLNVSAGTIRKAFAQNVPVVVLQTESTELIAFISSPKHAGELGAFMEFFRISVVGIWKIKK